MTKRCCGRMDMATICITGPNRGIGLELARQYRNRGDDVLAVLRVPTPEISATGAELFSGVDVSDERSVERLVRETGGPQDRCADQQCRHLPRPQRVGGDEP